MLPRLSASLLCLVLTGCSIFPSTWHPFGTPAAKAEKAEVRQEQAEAKVLVAAQEEVHKVNYAVDAAVSGNPYGLRVAQQHARTAQQLFDQALGQPPLASEESWRKLIAEQTSLDEKVRVEADAQNSKRLKELAELSADLKKKDVALEAANQRAVESARELQGFRDSVMRVAWVVGGLFALYFLGQFLQLLANFNPAFGTAANVVNAVVSPALHAGFHKARKAATALISP